MASHNTIGGTTPGSGNLISGNTNGVEIDGASGNLVQGNLIGTDTTGRLAMGNTGAGVLIENGSSSNTIGGPVGGARNVISGNAEGVAITGATTTGNVVAGNLIGTDINGTFAGQPLGRRYDLGRVGNDHRRHDDAGPQHHLGECR